MGGNRQRGSRRRERRQGAASEQRPAGGGPPERSRSRPRRRRTLDSWGGLTVVGSFAGAIVVVGALVLFNLPGSEVNDAPYVPFERTQVDGGRWGDPAAPVKIIEFADFQCPFCARFTHETEPLIAEEFIEPGTVELTFHHYAFLGPESIRAAEASECAATQDRFWDYRDLLFLRQGRENSGVFSQGNLKDFARELHVAFPEFDVDQFDACLDSGSMRGAVEQATNAAAEAGISQTPVFLVDGKLVSGAQDIDVFREAIRQALAE